MKEIDNRTPLSYSLLSDGSFSKGKNTFQKGKKLMTKNIKTCYIIDYINREKYQ